LLTEIDELKGDKDLLTSQVSLTMLVDS